MVHDNGRKRTLAGNSSTLYGNTVGSGRSSCLTRCIKECSRYGYLLIVMSLQLKEQKSIDGGYFEGLMMD